MVTVRISNASTELGKKWRIDDDGMLRVTMRVVKEGVYDYLDSDLPITFEDSKGRIPVALFRSEFIEPFLTSIEGKPVIINSHEWRTADNTNRDGLTVGAIAGKPRVVGDSVIVDAVITDSITRNAIMSGELTEVSAAYNAACEKESGKLAGVPYKAKQEDLEFNHVLLLPKDKGRMGNDVRILNSKSKGEIMSVTVKRRFSNSKSERVYTFSNEDDAKEAERLCNEAEEEKEKEKEKLENECAKLKNERDEAMSAVKALEKRVADLSSAEHAEALARMVTAQDADERAVLESALVNETLEETAVEKVRGELKNSKTMQERRAFLVSHMFNAQGIDTAHFDNAAIDGAFEAMVLNAKTTLNRAKVMNSKRSTVGRPKQQHIENSNTFDPTERILRPMAAFAERKGE